MDKSMLWLWGMFVLIVAATVLLVPLAQKNISQQNNVQTNQATQTPPAIKNTSHSKSEVAKHMKANDCWVIIHDKIYVATTFLPLLQGKVATDQICGKDNSRMFDKTLRSYGNMYNGLIQSTMQQYFVGNVK